jgi:hypothetical protein
LSKMPSTAVTLDDEEDFRDLPSPLPHLMRQKIFRESRVSRSQIDLQGCWIH